MADSPCEKEKDLLERIKNPELGLRLDVFPDCVMLRWFSNTGELHGLRLPHEDTEWLAGAFEKAAERIAIHRESAGEGK